MTHDDSTRPSLEVGRRGLIKAGSIGALGLGLAGMTLHEAHAAPAAAGKSSGPVTGIATKARLAFRPDSKFKTIQFNDTQDGARTDRRTVEFMEKAIAAEKPDLVVLVGDQLTSDAQTVLQQKQALNNVIQPMERAGVAWAATFGNHDEDPTSKTGMDEPAMLDFFRTYERNVNTAGAQGITGTGNMNLLIGDSRDGEPMFGVWLLDSGRYTPKEIAGQDFEGYPDWDWLRADQIRWYLDGSELVQRRAGAKVPSLMFIHIALWEHRFMWFASVDSRKPEDHARALKKHSTVGERNEDECPGPFNSGMFSAIQHRGDVKGVFVGHDHTNTYVGDYYGVKLGYGPGTGFGPYGLDAEAKHRMRGCRVFELDENAKDVWTGTRVVFAKDFGIDLWVPKQPMTPLPLGRRQR